MIVGIDWRNFSITLSFNWHGKNSISSSWYKRTGARAPWHVGISNITKFSKKKKKPCFPCSYTNFSRYVLCLAQSIIPVDFDIYFFAVQSLHLCPVSSYVHAKIFPHSASTFLDKFVYFPCTNSQKHSRSFSSKFSQSSPCMKLART